MTETIIHRDPVPTGVRRIALAFVLSAGLIAGSFAVVAGEDEKPADAAPITFVADNTWRDIPPLGGALSPTTLRGTQGQVLSGGAGNKVWVGIRGLDNGVWVSYMNINPTSVSPGAWANFWVNLGGQTNLPVHWLSSNSEAALRIRVVGTDGNTYGRTFTHQGWGPWYAHSTGTAAYWGAYGETVTWVANDQSWEQDYQINVRLNGQEPEYRGFGLFL